jgi:hypothetical protein
VYLPAKHRAEDEYTNSQQAEMLEQLQSEDASRVTVTTLSTEELQLAALRESADDFSVRVKTLGSEGFLHPGDWAGRIHTTAISLHRYEDDVFERGFVQGGERSADPRVMESFLKKGPAHWPETTWPGQGGVCVIQGHRTTNTGPFFNLNELKPGDEIVIIMDYARVTYRVLGQQGGLGWFKVPELEAEASALVYAGPEQLQAEMLVLMACHPRFHGYERIIVQAEMTDFELLTPVDGSTEVNQITGGG